MKFTLTYIPKFRQQSIQHASINFFPWSRNFFLSQVGKWKRKSIHISRGASEREILLMKICAPHLTNFLGSSWICQENFSPRDLESSLIGSRKKALAFVRKLCKVFKSFSECLKARKLLRLLKSLRKSLCLSLAPQKLSFILFVNLYLGIFTKNSPNHSSNFISLSGSLVAFFSFVDSKQLTNKFWVSPSWQQHHTEKCF